MGNINDVINNMINGEIDGFSGSIAAGDPLSVAILVVSCAILIVAVFSIIISIYLAVRYIKYNRMTNSCGLSGELIARKQLDKNGLSNIDVSCSGSILFGNSYSHYFKKVRLRRRTWKKASVSSLAMASQKCALAILDKENDPDMIKRVKLTPIISFGPIMFIPLVIIGIIFDSIIYHSVGKMTIVFMIIALIFFILSFIMSILVLKTEIKAQTKAIKMVSENGMATDEEIGFMKKLFKLYNIEYVNNLILSLLEIISYILRIMQMARGNSSGAGSLSK